MHTAKFKRGPQAQYFDVAAKSATRLANLARSADSAKPAFFVLQDTAVSRADLAVAEEVRWGLLPTLFPLRGPWERPSGAPLAVCCRATGILLLYWGTKSNFD